MIGNYHQPPSGNQRMNAAKCGGRQITGASNGDESLTKYLMEKICESSNMNRAYKRVKANKRCSRS